MSAVVPNRKSIAPKALSLFSGCGGFCEGMHRAGFRVATAVELDRFACETYRLNFPTTKLYEGDVETFNSLSREELQREGHDLDDLSLIFGGPPCQGYSQIGTRDLDDPRNQLYKQFTTALTRFQPPMFVMENVPNMLLLRGGLFRDRALAEFKKVGYPNPGVVVLDASEFGVPQQRRRVFYVGVRGDICPSYDLGHRMNELLDEHRTTRPTTVWEAIGDLPVDVVDSGATMSYPRASNLSAFMREMRLNTDGLIYSASQKLTQGGLGNPPSARLHNHHTKEIQERRLRLIRKLAPGLKADSLPKHMWDGARPEKWRRLHPDQLSHTILAQMHRDLSEFVHPTLDRWITVREALRLQSFHDGFVAASSEWQQFKQVGNAVPPLLARVVGLAAREVLAEVEGRKEKPARARPPKGSQMALDGVR